MKLALMNKNVEVTMTAVELKRLTDVTPKQQEIYVMRKFIQNFREMYGDCLNDCHTEINIFRVNKRL